MDYRAWSRNFNMHFGYYRMGLNPFSLERMLNEMNTQVFARLDLKSGMEVVDLGCGLGAPARALVGKHPVKLTAVTKVQYQIDVAKSLTDNLPLTGEVNWKLGDFNALDLPSGKFDGAFSIEASCHSLGASKEPFIKESARVLKSGGRLVVADGFMKRSRDRLPRWYCAILDYVTHHWAVECFADLEAFKDALKKNGFQVVAVEDLSWTIAPSVMHVPRVTLKWLFTEVFFKKRPLNNVRWGHVIASVLSPFVGIFRGYFGYYLITARKNF